MKICRVILNLPATKCQVYNGDPWENHKNIVYKLFKAGPQAYIKRIKNIISFANEQNADITLLPACTFVNESNHDDIKRYYKNSKKCAVLSGVLTKNNQTFSESAAYLEDGKKKSTFTSENVEQLNFKDQPFLSAISSTICKIHKEDILAERDSSLNWQKDVIALDMGHHQYNGRYMLSLKAVKSKMEKVFKGNQNVILAFWRYDKWNISSPWIASSIQSKIQRESIADDLVDIISV